MTIARARRTHIQPITYAACIGLFSIILFTTGSRVALARWETNAACIRWAISGIVNSGESGSLELKTDWDASKWGKSNFGQTWVEHLPYRESTAIEEYQTYRFEAINSYLRGLKHNLTPAESAKIHETIAQLDRATAKAVVPEDVMFFRHDQGSSELDEVWMGKNVYNPKSYLSTSLTRGWCLERIKKRSDYLLEIELPKGATGAYLDKLPDFMDVPNWKGYQEREFLLPRNSRFIITRRFWNGRYRVIRLKLIP